MHFIVFVQYYDISAAQSANSETAFSASVLQSFQVIINVKCYCIYISLLCFPESFKEEYQVKDVERCKVSYIIWPR